MSYNMFTFGKDLTFSLDEFNEPKMLTETEMIKNIVLYILFSKPGQYPSLPMIGLDIDTILHTQFDDIDTNAIKTSIVNQCSILNASFNSGNIIIQKAMYNNSPALYIKIKASTTGLSTYTENGYDIGIGYDEMKELLCDIVEI